MLQFKMTLGSNYNLDKENVNKLESILQKESF